VLRITKVTETPTFVILKLEGRIVSEWVAILRRECVAALDAQRMVLLDCSGVIFINGRGVKMLKRLMSDNLQLINCSAFIESLLQGGNGGSC
jgi:anti-anti-sigma regulatory factor